MYIILITITLSLLIVWWYKRPPGTPPGPRGIPLLGVLPVLSSKPYEVFHRWSREHGPVLSVRVGREDWIILNGINVVREALVKQGNKFNGRPPNYFTDCLLSSGRRGLIFTDGKTWKTQRRFGVATFRKLLNAGRINFEDIIKEEAACLVQSISNANGKPQDCKQALMNASANVIHALLHGYRLEHGSEEFLKLSNFLNLFTLDPKRIWTVNAIIFCPAVRFFPPFRKEISEAIKTRRKSEAFLREEINKYFANLKNNNETKGFIDAFVKKAEGEEDSFTDTQLMYYIRDLFLGGTETATSSLLWCILAAAQHEKCQRKIQAEIDQGFGSSEPYFSNQQDFMPYTKAFIEEVFRFCTTTPLALPHLTTANASVNGYFIPKNSKVIVNLWGVHHDPNYFQSPHEFIPERFLDSDGELIKTQKVIPFSVGARTCLGEKLAKIEIFTFFVSILQCFNVKAAKEDPLPLLNDGILSTVYLPKSFKLIYENRS